MQVLGIVDIVWRGVNIPVENGATLRIGGMMNTPVTYGRKVGRAQQFQGSEVKATTNLERNQRLKDLLSEGEGSLQVVCDTNQTFTWDDAFLSGDRPTATGGEGGKIELTWSGGEPEEVIG